jgi:hypothetical protein
VAANTAAYDNGSDLVLPCQWLPPAASTGMLPSRLCWSACCLRTGTTCRPTKTRWKHACACLLSGLGQMEPILDKMQTKIGSILVCMLSKIGSICLRTGPLAGMADCIPVICTFNQLTKGIHCSTMLLSLSVDVGTPCRQAHLVGYCIKARSVVNCMPTSLTESTISTKLYAA